MIKIINKEQNMLIPSINGKDIFVKKKTEAEVAIGDYYRMLNIYGKNVEVISISKDDKREDEKTIVKITKPSLLSETKERKFKKS